MVMAGFPMPIFGVKGTRVVVGMTLLWSLCKGRVWVWGDSLRGVPRARGQEWEGEETISANLSTDVLKGFSSKDELGNDSMGLLSRVVSISSEVSEAVVLTVSASVM